MNIEPCMWCGSRMEMNKFPDNINYYVRCTNEDCKSFGPDADSKKRAITAWNEVARIVRGAKEKKSECPICNGTGYITDINSFMGSRSRCYNCNGEGMVSHGHELPEIEENRE